MTKKAQSQDAREASRGGPGGPGAQVEFHQIGNYPAYIALVDRKGRHSFALLWRGLPYNDWSLAYYPPGAFSAAGDPPNSMKYRCSGLGHAKEIAAALVTGDYRYSFVPFLS